MNIKANLICWLAVFTMIPIGLLTPFYVHAQSEFLVSNTGDNGQGSLRQAILDANANPGADIISFDTSAGSPFADGIPDTINLSSGQLRISEDLTIVGLGQDKLSIDALQNSRVFNIDDGNSNHLISVEIQKLRIVGGNVDGFFVGGGGIYNSETLSLIDCIVSGNKVGVLGDGGAGIRNRGGNLTLINSTVRDNDSGGTALQLGGGGILNDEGRTTLKNSNVSGNSAIESGGGILIFNGVLDVVDSVIERNSLTTNGKGGGISNTNGTVTLRNSIVRQNSALDITVASRNGFGGGIYNGLGSGNMTLIDSSVSNNTIQAGRGEVVLGGGIVNLSRLTLVGSTVSGNSAHQIIPLGQGFYGGIYNAGTVKINNSTISSNTALNGVGGIGNDGILVLNNSTVSHNIDQSALVNIGGVFNRGTLTLANSIIANSTGGVDVANDPAGSIIIKGANLVEDGSVSGVLIGDPNLSSLQDNGGPTLTHAPLPGSPVIDAGDNSKIPADTFDLDGDGNITEPVPYDQRGPGFPRIVNTRVDIGAVERLADTTIQSFTLRAGLNAIAFSVTVPEDLDSCLALFDALGGSDAVKEIRHLNASTQQFEACNGQNGIDFDLEAGQGYLVHMKVNGELSVAGDTVCPTLTLVPGVNLVSHPQPPTDLTCYSLLTALGENIVTAIQRFDPVKGAYETCAFDNTAEGIFGGVDFAILAGEGLLVHVKDSATVVLPGCEIP